MSALRPVAAAAFGADASLPPPAGEAARRAEGGDTCGAGASAGLPPSACGTFPRSAGEGELCVCAAAAPSLSITATTVPSEISLPSLTLTSLTTPATGDGT